MPRLSAVDRTQVLPFPEASDLHQRIARSFALITDWTAALSGRFALDDVMAILTRQVGARNITLYRLTLDKVRPISTCAQAFGRHPEELSSGSVARYIRDTHPDRLAPGSIWRVKDLQREPGFAATPAAREWGQRTEICEVSLVVLEASEDHLDVFEMIFDNAPRTHPDLPVSIVTQAMADAWSARAPGLIGSKINAYGRSRRRNAPAADSAILGSANPCGLTRSELRVAQLLGTGTKAKEIATELRLSVPTVRTHLRNIYAKTDTGGQVELLALLAQQAEATH